MSPGRFCAVVPAAGAASRMGAGPPKPYRRLAGAAVMAWALAPLLRRPELARLVIVRAPGDEALAYHVDTTDRRIMAVEGGASRAESVARGVAALEDCDSDAPVLVHDAARPCLSDGDLERLLDAACEPDGALLAVPVRDTLKRSDGGDRVATTVPRSGLWQALTPQGFPRERLEAALAHADETVTDEASAIERMGGHPRLVEGDPANIKITHPADLALAEAILAGRGVEAAS